MSGHQPSRLAFLPGQRNRARRPLDLAALSIADLYALSDRAFREMDRLVPVEGSHSRYYELMAELDARSVDEQGA